MGHYIQSSKFENLTDYGKNAFDETNKRLYTALDCESLYGGVSGLGCHREFEIEELESALELCMQNNWEEETTFLKETLDKAKDEKSVMIYFG